MANQHPDVTFLPQMTACIKNLVYENYFADNSDREEMTIKLFTEYCRSGVRFRAHPLYHTTGSSWYDWVIVRYEKSERDRATGKTYKQLCDTEENDLDNDFDPDQFHYAPAKLLGFLEIQNELSAVVSCCKFEHKQSAPFMTYWKQEYIDTNETNPLCMILDLNAVVRHCLMIPENDQNRTFHEVWERDKWATAFL